LPVGQRPGKAEDLVAEVGKDAVETFHIGERSVSRPVWEWVQSRESTRSRLLTGLRQTGKTTLYRQTIRRLLEEEYPQ
jgi:predicted AAA+ superfamily ATPase